jgi:hypothetical protein
MLFFSQIPRNPYDFLPFLYEENFNGFNYVFGIYKSGIAGRTYVSFCMDFLYPAIEEEDSRQIMEGRTFAIDQDLISLRLDTIRHAFSDDLPF